MQPLCQHLNPRHFTQTGISDAIIGAAHQKNEEEMQQEERTPSTQLCRFKLKGSDNMVTCKYESY